MKNGAILIIAGIIVVMVCISSSCAIGYFMFFQKQEPPPPAGQIGADCIDGISCNSTESVSLYCKSGKCFEKCKDVVGSFGCQYGKDVPMNGFYCDYTKCDDFLNNPAEEEINTSPSIIDIAIEQEALRDAEKVERQRLQAEAEALAQQKIEQQKLNCECASFAGIRQLPDPCATGKWLSDGSDQHKWCYVKGGTTCTSATRTLNIPSQTGMAWKICG